jgi:hypothetical protein
MNMAKINMSVIIMDKMKNNLNTYGKPNHIKLIIFLNWLWVY